MKFSFLALPLLAILTISAASAEAPELRVGYTMSATGSAAALGVPRKIPPNCFRPRSVALRPNTLYSMTAPTAPARWPTPAS